MLVPLSAGSIEGFTISFLLDRYADRRPVATHHRRWWEAVCSSHPRVAIAAPRDHSKTTSLNHAYGLAASLFEQAPFQIKISKTYEHACERVMQAKQELITNEKLRRIFRLRKFDRERENDFIAVRDDGYRFRVMGFGMGQSIRGINWDTMRPNLVLCDDIENDEEVMNPEVREAGMRWLLNTILPLGGDNFKIRVYGTILHEDSILNRLLKMSSWQSIRDQACDEEVSEGSILWPERYPRDRLLALKQQFIDAGNIGGFNMEYRNVAISDDTSFFRKEDFRPMTDEDHKKKKTYYVGGDLAISAKQKRDWTVFYVGGLDEDGQLHIVDERRGRWDANAIIDEMFSIHQAWDPAEWFVEDGAILKALHAALDIRMREEGFLNICPGLVPTQDKAVRAMPAQARMRARGMKFDTNSSWFPDAMEEWRAFAKEGTRGAHDDRVDALAWLCQGIKRMAQPKSEADIDVEEMLLARRRARETKLSGLSAVTGYEFIRAQVH